MGYESFAYSFNYCHFSAIFPIASKAFIKCPPPLAAYNIYQLYLAGAAYSTTWLSAVFVVAINVAVAIPDPVSVMVFTPELANFRSVFRADWTPC